MTRPLELVRLGRCGYRQAWDLQRVLARGKYDGSDADTLILVEHPPVITLGRRANAAHVLLEASTLRERGVECLTVDRGGDVTYHGPGQLVVYPVLDLKAHRQDVGWMLRGLEQAIIDCLAVWDIPAYRDPPYTGVWTERGKIAAIGIAVSHWVTYHGLALNVNPDLGHFRWITPCGIGDRAVTSMAAFQPDAALDVWQVGEDFVRAFAEVFDCAPVEPARAQG